jgi:rhodanese-related sulfurtransferase
MMMNAPLVQITVQDLAQKMAAGSEALQLVDVREVSELEVASVPGFMNLPLSAYESWQTDIHSRLESETETLVLCHHGMRSAQMCQWLMSQGFTNVKNISGGIDAYSIYIDPSIAQY